MLSLKDFYPGQMVYFFGPLPGLYITDDLQLKKAKVIEAQENRILIDYDPYQLDFRIPHGETGDYLVDAYGGDAKIFLSTQAFEEWKLRKWFANHAEILCDCLSFEQLLAIKGFYDAARREGG